MDLLALDGSCWFLLILYLETGISMLPLFLATIIAQEPHTVESLLDAHSRCKQESQFSSTYEYFEKVSDRDVDPLAAIREQKPIVTGVYLKNGRLSRYSKIYTKSPATVDRDDSGVPEDLIFMRNVSWESVFNRDLELHYTPRWKDDLDHAVYTARAELPSSAGGMFHAETEVSPLNPIHGSFEGLPGIPPYEGVWSVKTTASDHIIIAKTVTGRTGVPIECEVEFWTKPDVPVVRRVHVTYFQKGIAPVTTQCYLSDWVACGKFMIARTVINTLDLPTPKSTDRLSDRTQLVRMWRSRDLNASVPTNDRFFLSIPGTTRIVGLSDAPPAGQRRRVSILNIKRGDLLPKGKIIKK